MDPVTRLDEVWREHRAPHLVTVSDGRPHVVPVTVTVRGGAFRAAPPGRRTRANVDSDGRATLVWSPAEDGGYSLIVDGAATVHDDAVHVRPERAVRHRPADGPAGPGPGCGADCVELDPALSDRYD